MWNDLDNWEHKNKAVVFMVVSTEEVRESLSYYNAFDVESEGTYDSEFICNINDVSERLIMASMKYAYNTIDEPTYNYMLEVIYDHLVDTLKERIKDAVDKQRPVRGNLWNAETKGFEKLQDFMGQRTTQKELF